MTATLTLLPLCMYRNAPGKDCGARACPLHGTPSASPYGVRRGAVIAPATDEQIERSFDAYR
jgi:hypothetical protein